MLLQFWVDARSTQLLHLETSIHRMELQLAAYSGSQRPVQGGASNRVLQGCCSRMSVYLFVHDPSLDTDAPERGVILSEHADGER